MRNGHLALALTTLILAHTVATPVQGATAVTGRAGGPDASGRLPTWVSAQSDALARQDDESGSSATVTFDDRAGGDQVLSGHYPEQAIDWGTAHWYHASPWKGFTTKSVSFNGRGVGSASFAFVTPRRLVRLDAYNGGAATTLTLSCAGQPDKQVSLGGGQGVTIETGWTGRCTMVTIASSNGWETNFDNLVHDAGP